jgi:CBS domain-containing protein
MKVKDLMTSEVTSCDLNASLADAAKAMWDHDCGVLPVLKDGEELVGVITDRDICMASAMRDSNPSQISVEESITGEVFSTTP